MNSHIPDVLTPTLESCISLIDQKLPGFLSAFYIVGSIALDEFNPHFSDVDFVAVVSHQATDGEMNALREIHREVEQDHPRWKLSGAYLLQGDLGKSSHEIGKRIVYHDGKLGLQDNFEANPVTWWTLKNHGISVRGPEPQDLPIAVETQILVDWTRENLHTYWKSWIQRLDRIIILLSDWGIQWAVLGVARQLYTIRENGVIPKQRAGAYALDILPERWHRIIHEAIGIRTKTNASLYQNRFMRMLDAVDLLKYVIHLSAADLD